MKFRDLMLSLADKIGRHHVPVDDQAHEIGEFLADDAIHHELMKSVVRSVYRANRCGHLNAVVLAEATFDALGQIRGQLLRSENTDIEAIRLMDQIDDHIGRLFEANASDATTSSAGVASTEQNEALSEVSAVHSFSAAGQRIEH